MLIEHKVCAVLRTGNSRHSRTPSSIRILADNNTVPPPSETTVIGNFLRDRLAVSGLPFIGIKANQSAIAGNSKFRFPSVMCT
jgi:hypothetical protein